MTRSILKWTGRAAAGLLGLVVRLNPLTVSMNLVLSGPNWIADNPVYFFGEVALSLVALWVAALTFRRMSSNFADYI